MTPEALARLFRKDLTPGDVHVDVPGQRGGKGRRKQIADALRSVLALKSNTAHDARGRFAVSMSSTGSGFQAEITHPGGKTSTAETREHKGQHILTLVHVDEAHRGQGAGHALVSALNEKVGGPLRSSGLYSPAGKRFVTALQRQGHVTETDRGEHLIHIKKTDPGLYVARKITPACEAKLRAWCPGLDEDPHVTVLFSTKTIPWSPDVTPLTVPRSQFLGFQVLGQDRAWVLRFECAALQSRWAAAVSAGAAVTYESMQPHLTLNYTGPDAPITVPPFDLEFGPEVTGPLKTDVFKFDLEALAEAVHDSWCAHCEDPSDPHNIPYAQLSEKAKQVDRDAVLAVLRIAKADKPGQVHGAGGKYVAGSGAKKSPLHETAQFHAQVQALLEPKAPEKPMPVKPVMFTGKEGNIGKFQQKLVDQLDEAHASGNPQAVANIKLPLSASKVVKDYQKALLEHQGSELKPQYVVPVIKPKLPKPATNTEAVAAKIAGKATPHPMPALPQAPAVDTKFPADQQALFKTKVAQLQSAYQSKNPVEAIQAIPAYSPAVQTYKAQLLNTAQGWENSKPAPTLEVGQSINSLKIVSHSGAEPIKKFPERKHEDFNVAARDYRQSLTTEEKKALNSYQGGGYHEMNSTLRSNPGAGTAQHEALDRVLGGASFPHDTHVIRNFSADGLPAKAKGLVGKIIEDPAYMSSSLRGSFASNASVSLHLNVPAGSKALYLNHAYSGNGTDAYEHEVLLARRTRWRVDSVEMVNGKTVIHAHVLPVSQQPSVMKYAKHYG